MARDIQNHLVFCLNIQRLKVQKLNTVFQKLYLFLSLGKKGGKYLLSSTHQIDEQRSAPMGQY